MEVRDLVKVYLHTILKIHFPFGGELREKILIKVMTLQIEVKLLCGKGTRKELYSFKKAVGK